MNDDPTEDWVWDPERSCFLKPSLFDGQWNIAKVPVFELGNPIYQYDPKRHRIYQDVLREQEKMEQAQVMQQQQTQSPQRETTVGWSVYANAPKPAATQQPESWEMDKTNTKPKYESYMDRLYKNSPFYKYWQQPPQRPIPSLPRNTINRLSAGWSVDANALEPEATQQSESWEMDRTDTKPKYQNYMDNLYENRSFYTPSNSNKNILITSSPQPQKENQQNYNLENLMYQWGDKNIPYQNIKNPFSYYVEDKNGNFLFQLGDQDTNNIEKTTALDLYNKGIQWFAPSANNYMPIVYISPQLQTIESVKHINSDDMYDFINTSRNPIEYRSGGSGDWKIHPNGADGHFLCEVDGYPFWADGIGQIPYAADSYQYHLNKWYGTPKTASILTTGLGGIFGAGSIPKAALPFYWDFDNNYDNSIVKDVTTHSGKLENPSNFKNFPLLEKGKNARNYYIKDSDGNFLFQLGGNKNIPTDTISVQQLKEKGIQWYSPRNESYLPIETVNPYLREMSSVNHIMPEDLTDFIQNSGFPKKYSSIGIGHPNINNKYTISEVDGNPFWMDDIRIAAMQRKNWENLYPMLQDTIIPRFLNKEQISFK